MKRFLAVIILILILALPVFAGGTNEWIGIIGGSAFGAGAVAGGLYGAGAGPIGIAIGAIIGGIVGAVGGGMIGHGNDIQQKANEESRKLRVNEMYQDQYVSAKQTYDQNYTNYQNALVGLQQAEANINSYDEALLRWQDQYDIGLGQIQRQGEADYRTVMGNFAGQSYINAMTGQTGGTADILAKQQRDQVVSLVGNDLKLDSNGGVYGTQLREYDLDANADFRSLVEQREIELAAYNKTKSETAKYAAELEDSKEGLKKAAKQYYEHGDEKYSSYMQQVEQDTIEEVSGIERNSDVDDEIERIKKRRVYK